MAVKKTFYYVNKKYYICNGIKQENNSKKKIKELFFRLWNRRIGFAEINGKTKPMVSNSGICNL